MLIYANHIKTSWIILSFNFHFEFKNLGEEGGQTEKFEDLENKNNFSDDIRSIFSQFLKGFLSAQYTKRADITFKNLGLIFCT